jgi:hypothetical protein
VLGEVRAGAEEKADDLNTRTEISTKKHDISPFAKYRLWQTVNVLLRYRKLPKCALCKTLKVRVQILASSASFLKSVTNLKYVWGQLQRERERIFKPWVRFLTSSFYRRMHPLKQVSILSYIIPWSSCFSCRYEFIHWKCGAVHIFVIKLFWKHRCTNQH